LVIETPIHKKGKNNMYKYPNIEETLNEICEKEFSVSKVVNTITDFIEKMENKTSVIGVFDIDEFGDMCRKAGIKIENTYDITGYTNALKAIANTDKVDEKEKENFVRDFARYFGECSSDEDFCEDKIYVVIKNLSDNDDSDIVNKYDSWDEADKDVDDIYTGFCDDIYIAEVMWYEILGWIRERNCDAYNFCSVVDFDARGIEDGREYWEAENCEPDEDDDEEEYDDEE
jgi:hypothetical protein